MEQPDVFSPEFWQLLLQGKRWALCLVFMRQINDEMHGSGCRTAAVEAEAGGEPVGTAV